MSSRRTHVRYMVPALRLRRALWLGVEPFALSSTGSPSVLMGGTSVLMGSLSVTGGGGEHWPVSSHLSAWVAASCAYDSRASSSQPSGTNGRREGTAHGKARRTNELPAPSSRSSPSLSSSSSSPASSSASLLPPAHATSVSRLLRGDVRVARVAARRFGAELTEQNLAAVVDEAAKLVDGGAHTLADAGEVRIPPLESEDGIRVSLSVVVDPCRIQGPRKLRLWLGVVEQRGD